MSNDSEDHISDEETRLNKLIREAYREKPGEFVRPSADTIDAYLDGTATEEQVKEVREALIRSEEFAREMLQMSKDMEILAGPEAPWDRKEMEQIVVPDYEEFLAAHGEIPPVKTAVPIAAEPIAKGESIFVELRRKLWPETSWILKPILLWGLILLLAIPAYHGMIMLAKKGEVHTEVVDLAYDQRGSTEADASTIELEAQTQYHLIVPLEKQIRGDSLSIRLEMLDGTQVWRHKVIVRSGRSVSFRLPQSELRTMLYRLVILDDQTGESQKRYFSIIKK
jgi:hypothetical protein